MNNKVLAQVAALPKMGAPELKKMYCTDPPPFNKPYYVKQLAYRIQEWLIVEESTRDCLPSVSMTWINQQRKVSGLKCIAPQLAHDSCVNGMGMDTMLQSLRMVLNIGERYTSLSAIARKITCKRWNGLVFFGFKRMKDYRHV